MFIAHFNRYFEKHARITYIVLLLIIIATFVIFVTPGEVFRGEKTLSDFGEIYGRKLTVERVQKGMARTTIGLWFQYPQAFGQDFSSNKEMLFTEMLSRIRLMHYAEEKGMDEVSDDEVRTAIASFEAFQEKGTFSQERFENFLAYIKRSFDVLPAEFDDILRENVIAERVTKSVTDGMTVADSEVDAELAQYVLKCATFRMSTRDAVPTEEEIQAFFATRKADIKLPDGKNALVAVFSFESFLKGMEKDAELSKALTPSAEEISAYYERNKERLFKGKNLQEASATASRLLLMDKVRAEVRRRAGKIYDDFATRVQNEDAAARLARFRKAAEAAGAVCQSSGLVSTEDAISGMNGAQTNLAAAIRNAAEVGDVTRLAIGAGYAAIACITEKTPTAVPAALPEAVAGATTLDPIRQIIADAIVGERAKAFFDSRIAQPFQVYQAEINAVKEEAGLNDTARWGRIRAAEEKLDSDLVLRFFIEEKRDFALVSFAPSAYAAKVQEPTAEDLAKAYEAGKADYEAVHVRLSKMTFADAEKADAAQASLKAGKDFAAVAAEFTESKKSVDDKVLVSVESLSAAVKAAVAGLKKGEVSAVIADGESRLIAKVLERQEPRTLDDVKAELTASLKDAAARSMADCAAAELSRQLNEAWWSAAGDKAAEASQPDGVALLKKLAAAYPEATYEEFEQVSPYDRSQFESPVMGKIFSTSAKVPITANIVGTKASYVGCLAKVTEGHLADPATDAQYASVLKDAYSESVAMEAALKRAEAEKSRIAAALAANGGDFAAAAGEQKFDDLKPFSLNDLRSGDAEAVNDIRSTRFFEPAELLQELQGAKTGTFLPIQAAKRSFYASAGNPYARNLIPVGYQLLYVDGCQPAVAGEDAAKVREDVRSRLLLQKQQKALADLMTELEEKSKTYIRPETSFGRQ